MKEISHVAVRQIAVEFLKQRKKDRENRNLNSRAERRRLDCKGYMSNRFGRTSLG